MADLGKKLNGLKKKAVESLQEAASSETAQKLAAKASEGATRAAKKLDEFAEQVREADTIREAADNVPQSVKHTADYVSHGVKQAADDVTGTIKKVKLSKLVEHKIQKPERPADDRLGIALRSTTQKSVGKAIDKQKTAIIVCVCALVFVILLLFSLSLMSGEDDKTATVSEKTSTTAQTEQKREKKEQSETAQTKEGETKALDAASLKGRDAAEVINELKVQGKTIKSTFPGGTEYASDQTQEILDDVTIDKHWVIDSVKIEGDKVTLYVEVKQLDTVFTAENNPELAEVLQLPDYLDPKIAAFADKYARQTIEFDGYVSDVGSPIGDGTQVWSDTLVSAGNYDPNHMVGPYFDLGGISGNHFKDDGSYDLDYGSATDGKPFPSYLQKNSNVRFKVRIGSFDENQGKLHCQLLAVTPR